MWFRQGALGLGLLCASSSACKPEPLLGEETTGVVTETVDGADQAVDGASQAPLLSIDGRLLTVAEFEARAALMSEVARAKLDVPQSRTQLLEAFVWVELLARLGEAAGLIGGAEEALFGHEVEARANLEDHVARTLDRGALEGRWRAYFDAHQSEWERPPRRQVRGMTLPERSQAEAIREEMVVALEHARPEHVFRAYHQLFETGDPTLGAWGWVEESEHGDPAVLEQIFGLEVDTLSPVFASTRGWELVYVEVVEDGFSLSFEDAESYAQMRVVAAAKGELMREALDAGRAAMGASVDLAAVSRLAELRADEPERRERPRRYSLEALSGAHVTELGVDVLAEVNEEVAARGRNASVVPMDPPAISPAPEGSGAPTMTP